MQCSVFIAMSLDGFIARADGKIDWLESAHATAPAGEDFGYRTFFDSVDVLVMGRKTLETVLAFPKWLYGEKRLIVLSRHWTQLPNGCPSTVSLRSGSPEEVVASLAAERVRHAYVDGGATIGGFLAAGLIDELTITTIPILIGDGIRLFGPLPQDVRLDLQEARSYSCGFVQSKYRVVR
jgi:dihydrofolate reductase